MGYHHACHAAPADGGKEQHDALRVDRVQRARRLIAQQELAVADHRAGDRNPLAFTAGELIGEVAGPLGDAQLGEGLHPGRVRRPGRTPSSSSGTVTFSMALKPASRLKSWKT